LDDDRQLLFDDNDQVAAEILKFIDEALSEQFGVLIHSIRGQSRASCVLIIYFMMKFNWSLMKALEYVTSRRPNLEIRASFL
jgi:protein-tyrosine phosphatase